MKLVKNVCWQIILFTLFISVSGCGSNGLKRTSFDKWEIKEFPNLSLGIDLPAGKKNAYLKVYDSQNYLDDDQERSLVYLFHPVYHGSFTDALYLGELHLVLLSRKNYESYKNGKHFVATDYRTFKKTEFYPEITEYEVVHPNGRTPLRCFRKDIKNAKTGDVILATITYMDNVKGNVQHKDEDLKAIKRILNSIKFLDNKQKKKGTRGQAPAIDKD